MLSINAVSKKFGSFTAVDNLNLQLAPGDFFGFLGPNGAGKTTTIKMVAGLLTPTHGSISIGGYDVLTAPTEAKKILGYIPDQPYLYDKLSGKEFLYFSGGLYGLNDAELKLRVEEAAELLQLDTWFDRRIESYSQGMKQRVAIASSLLHHPRLLLVDEPMVGLDPQSAKIVKELFTNLSSKGVTILMSTHSLHIAEEICQRIGVLKNGSLIFNDTMAGLKDFIKSDYGNLEGFFLELLK